MLALAHLLADVTGTPDPNGYTPQEAERLDRELARSRLRQGRTKALPGRGR